MDRPHLFETVLAELERALAAAYRYDSLRQDAAACRRGARPDISRRIFEEFYAARGRAEAARSPGKMSAVHLSRVESAATMS